MADAVNSKGIKTYASSDERHQNGGCIRDDKIAAVISVYVAGSGEIYRGISFCPGMVVSYYSLITSEPNRTARRGFGFLTLDWKN